MKHGYLKAFGLASTLVLAGCNEDVDHYVGKEFTDVHVQRLLVNTEDDKTLINRYHVMTGKDGNELGIVFIRSVENNEEASLVCAKYRAFAAKVDQTHDHAEESATRRICIANDLSLGK